MKHGESRSRFDAALVSSDFYDDPHSLFHRMREEAPVYWSEAWQAWVLTRYDDVIRVLRDAAGFSSAGRVSYLLESLPPAARQQVTALERHYNTGIAHTDPPDHTRLRGLLNHIFTPRMVAHWEARVETVTHELIDKAAAGDEFDIISDIAYPLPATIIAEMIGAPNQDIALFRNWAVAINRLFERGGKVQASAVYDAQHNLGVMREYISDLAQAKRQLPADDILSRLIDTEIEQLSMDEIVSTCVTLFVAGHETTTNLIGNGMLALLQHPDQLQYLRTHPEAIDKTIEEMLRYEPSVPRGWRITKMDAEVGGETLRAGSLVFPMLAAANRDPAHFTQPDRFDITRTQNRHLAFGYGIHFCLGAPLARLEGKVAINTLLARLPHLELATAKPIWRPDMAVRSLESLPVNLRRQGDLSAVASPGE